MQTRCVLNINVRPQAVAHLPSCCATNLYLFEERLDGRETGDAAARWRVRARAAGAAGREARGPETGVYARAPSGHCGTAERWLRSHPVKRFFHSHDCCHYVRLLPFSSGDTKCSEATPLLIYIPRCGYPHVCARTRTIVLFSALRMRRVLARSPYLEPSLGNCAEFSSPPPPPPQGTRPCHKVMCIIISRQSRVNRHTVDQQPAGRQRRSRSCVERERAVCCGLVAAAPSSLPTQRPGILANLLVIRQLNRSDAAVAIRSL